MADSQPPLNDPAWIPPKKALEIVALSQGASAGAVLMEHIKGAILPIWCARRSLTEDGGNPTVTDEPGSIPAAWWTSLQEENTFWNAATARFYFYDRLGGSRTIRCYGIVVMRAQVEKLFPPPEMKPATALEKNGYAVVPPPPPSVPVTPAVIHPIEPEIKGPPVAAGALGAWFKAYQMAFTGAADTEARALESARGCFPGKAVSRDAVRGLRGEQKRGPKGKDAK